MPVRPPSSGGTTSGNRSPGAPTSRQAIQDWTERKKREEHARVVDLIKKELAGGRVKVFANAFDADGDLVATDEWEADQLDAETAGKFGTKSKIRLTL